MPPPPPSPPSPLSSRSLHMALHALLVSVLILALASPASPQEYYRSNEGEIPQGAASLAFVFDVTGSMYDDLVQVIEGAAKILATTLARREKPLYNYVLVPFHDPEIGPITVTTDPDKFQEVLRDLYVQGGGDCPEMSIGAVQKALQEALPNSFIYVFTDARAKDYLLTEEVLTLIQQKQSQVVFVMTGDCGNTSHPGYQAYEQIASTSSGQIFLLKKSQVNQILNFVRVAVQSRKVNLLNIDSKVTDSIWYELPVDTKLQEVTVSMSGNGAKVIVKDPNGVRLTPGNGLTELLSLKNALIINVKEPMPGKWRLKMSASGQHSIRVTGLSGLDFVHGFSRKPTLQIERTAIRPIKGIPTFLLLNSTGLEAPGRFINIELLDLQGKRLLEMPVVQNRAQPNLYNISSFIPPNVYFFIKVNGIDKMGYEFQRTTLTALNVYEPIPPRVTIAKVSRGFYDKLALLNCSVDSIVPFNVQWYKDRRPIGNRLYFTESAVASHPVRKASSAAEGYYVCNATSAAGSSSASTYLDIKDPPPAIQPPRNVSVLPGETALLTCIARSTVEYNITWLRPSNDFDPSRFPRARDFANGSIQIRSVKESDEGAFVCRAQNEGGVTEETVWLIIQRAPIVTAHPESQGFVVGSTVNITCTSRGFPQPTYVWKRGGKVVPITTRVRYDTGGVIVLTELTKEDAGEYECEATNSAGIGSAIATLSYRVPPRLRNKGSTVLVNNGETATLVCDATGLPPPVITWYKGGIELRDLSFLQVNERGELVIVGTQAMDAGEYECVATNDGGSDSGTVTLKVGSAPVITAMPTSIGVDILQNASLPCAASGLPAPKITWRRADGRPIDFQYRFTQLRSGTLFIKGIRLEDEAMYTCTVKNQFGSQEVSAFITVTGVVRPLIAYTNPKIETVVGSTVEMTCHVLLGNPQPVIIWIRDGQLAGGAANAYDDGHGNLVITNVQVDDEGEYICLASNVGGNATYVTKLDVQVPPRIRRDQVDFIAIQGSTVRLPCRVDGDPRPQITWTKNGIRISDNDPHYFVNKEGSLDIFSVRAHDTATYSCTAMNIAGIQEQRLSLFVQVPPTIAHDLDEFTVIVDNPVQMACEARGVPPPVVYWTKDGVNVTGGEGAVEGRGDVKVRGDRSRPIIMSNGALRISHAAVKDKGVYVCVATSEAGTATKSVTLRVHVPPKITTRGQHQRVVLVGEKVVLGCVHLGYPPPVISWRKDRTKIDFFDLDHAYMLTEDGSLLIEAAVIGDTARYRCRAENPAGQANRMIHLIVHEPPSIADGTPTNMTVIENNRVVLPCPARGTPPPKVTWYHGDVRLTGNELGVTLLASGGLQIDNTQGENTGNYLCRAENVAGKAQHAISLLVYLPPRFKNRDGELVPEPMAPEQVSERDGRPVVLSCDVNAVPPPQITWLKNGREMRPADFRSGNVMISDGGRFLRIHKSQVSDTAIYECIVENRVGKIRKRFDLNVHVKPSIDEETASNANLTAILDSPLTIHCPINGVPQPRIIWFKDGFRIHPQNEINMRLLSNGRRLEISAVDVTDTGRYKCVGQNSAGQAELEFNLNVYVPAQIDGAGTVSEPDVVVNRSITLACPASGIPLPAVTWYKEDTRITANGTRILILDAGWRLQLLNAEVNDAGRYYCQALNVAGKAEKYYDLHVLVPPHIRRRGLDLNPKVVVNRTVVISCPVAGVPTPRIMWLRNDELLDAVRYPSISISTDGRQLRITSARISDSASYRCLAVNRAGEDNIDFQLEVQVPTFIDVTNIDRQPKVIINSNQILECPAVGIPFPKVEWLRNGVPINYAANPRLSVVKMHNGMPLRIMAIQVNDTATYECRAVNEAGTDKIVYELEVFVPPRIDDFASTGAKPQVVINRTILISCIADGIPKPRIKWLMNGRPLATLANPRFHLLADHRQLKIENADVADAARYTCIASNAAGVADKDFDLDVLVPPYIDDTDLDSNPTVIQGKHHILLCPANGIPYPDVKWFRGLRPIRDDVRMHVLLGGRQLRISASQRGDTGRYTCVATNIAGEARKHFDLQVLVPPTIDEANLVANPKVVLSRTVVLECPVEGTPPPRVRWLVNQAPLVPNSRMRLLSNGRKLELTNASVADTARYTCIATNEAGELRRNFDLDVLVPAHITDHKTLVKLYVIENRTVYIDCPADGIPPPTVEWLRDGVSLKFPHRNIRLLSNGHQLELRNVKLADEARYTCRARNMAGQQEKSFIVKVQVPPLIPGGGKITRLSVVVHQSIRLECRPSGDPKPNITWFKDGSIIDPKGSRHVRVLQGGRVLQLPSATPSDAGGYTCHAMNIAGEDQRRYNLQVHEPPTINGSRNTDQLSVTIGQSITMDCDATGSPKPQMWWVREGESLAFNTNPNLRVLRGGARLQVVNSQLMDIGGYTCVASNVAGNASKQFLLSVLVPPTIEDGLTEVAATVNSRTSLECETLGLPEPRVSWRKDGEPLPANGPRHRMQRSGSLEFSTVRVADSGVYECVAENEAGTATRSIQLRVLIPPTIEIADKSTRHVVVGDTVTLPCAASGVPKPRIMWQKGTRLLGNTPGYQLLPNGDLQISSAEIRDSGIYICVAQNSAGTDLGQLRLEVQVPPSIENQKTEFTVNQNREVSLPCRANGIPRPKIAWTKDGKAIATDEFRIRVLKSGWLMISITRIEDAGTYECTATNKAGTASVNVHVTVHVPPSIEDAPGSITKIQDESAELACKAAGFPPPRISWIKDGHAVIQSSGRHTISGKTGTLTIRKVQSKDTGSYVCTATNKAGRDSREIVLRILVPPTFTIIPKDEEVTANGRIKLVCAAKGIPTPVITWKVNNTNIPTSPSINGRSRLIIDNAMKKDDGTYMCFAENPAGKRRALAAVRVKVPPKVRLPPGTHAVSLSQRVLLHCPVEAGDPPPVIHWSKEGRPVELGHRIKQLKNGTLVIYDSTSQDAGDWKCVATNEAGTSEGIATLTVRSPPVFRNELRDMTVDEGEIVIMNCVADGEPKPTIKWRKERLVLTTEGRVTILANNSLRIVTSQMSDGGLYLCIANNPLGSVLLQATLTVQVHGSWANWESWSHCSVSCGHGDQHRVRTCARPQPRNGGRDCYGQSKERKTCMPVKCGIAGGWGEWSVWEVCSAECGSGQKTRQRSCNNPVPKFGGDNCSGSGNEEVVCNVRPCPEAGGWGDWSRWQGCSEVCGEGNKERFRRCENPAPQHGGEPCRGAEIEREPCKIRNCEKHGTWGEWAHWSACTLSCGGGQRRRQRACDSPSPSDGGRDCSGQARQINYCNKDICPVHGGWAMWSVWSDCTLPCGEGQRRRFRTCTSPTPKHNGRPCIGSSQDTQKCNRAKCSVDGLWGQWGSWSRCSRSCGSGEQKRFRSCQRPQFGGDKCIGDSSQRKKCNRHACRAGLPRFALGNVIGNINDQEFGIARLTANITRTGHGTQISGRLEDVPANIARHLQNMLSILTPVYWTTATEVGKAVNGFTLTYGLFRREVHVEFATGEILKMTHIARGLDREGVLQIDIIVNGNVPILPRKAKLAILPYHENYIQTGPGTLYAYSSRIFSLNGHPLPYAWNHTITYDESYGRMPYLVERLRANKLFVEYDEQTEDLVYRLTASIAKGKPSNKCPTGFLLDTSGPYCKDDDECSRLNSCTHFCHNNIGSFTCSCPPGMFLTTDGKTCNDIDECERGTANCGRGQECLNTIGSYRCVVKCKRGMRRASDGLSCKDINECVDRAGLCEHKCFNLVGGYRCSCRNGYRLIGKSKCTDIDECRSKLSLCSHTCRNTEGSYECSCPIGHRLVAAKTVCKDIDECVDGTHTCDRVEQECRNSVGGFTCIDICPRGYHKATNGTCIDIDECHTGETKCQYNQMCVNGAGGYRCACPRGFRSNGPDKPCVDIDECLERPGPCSYKCRNTHGGYICICPFGQKLLADKKSCAGLQFIDEPTVIGGPKCTRQGPGPRCPPLPGDQPTCPTGYHFISGKCIDIDECRQKNRCQHECHNLVGSYQCSCPGGYRVAANRRTCEDINECEELGIECGPEQMCFNRRGDFKCVDVRCPPSYERDSETGYCSLPCSKSEKPCPPGARYADVLEYRMLALPSGIPAHQDLLRLIAYNQDGVHLPETVFSIVESRQAAPPFGIKLRNGKGVVFTLKPLEQKKQYRLRVRARSYDRRKHNIQYQTTFVIFISVSMFPY